MQELGFQLEVVFFAWCGIDSAGGFSCCSWHFGFGKWHFELGGVLAGVALCRSWAFSLLVAWCVIDSPGGFCCCILIL